MGLRFGLFLFAAVGIAANGADCRSIPQIQQFIDRTWAALRRSNAALLKAAADQKVARDGGPIVYVPHDLSLPTIEGEIRRQLTAAEFSKITLVPLPEDGEPSRPGLLYLPHPYVVPGGRFNEMYGWDSYFILLGLLQDGQVKLAKNMTDNLIFEVTHYGKVLNANRSYYLSRSQPPFLTAMVLEVFHRTSDTSWLKSTLPALEDYYDYWTRQPHLTSQTGLSRYDGGTDTPAPEVTQGELDSSGRNDYVRVIQYYRTHAVPEYDLTKFYDRASERLTPLFYRADRAMRESGFDPSGRFGPFSAAILDYNPVDLNSLLYRMAMDISTIYTVLHQSQAAELWEMRARNRADVVNRLMWDEARSLYFDYDFQHKRRSGYGFLTTFYPLWVGIATPQQAARVAAQVSLFERAGGLATSTQVTGDQWDAPFGWAPLQLIAIRGLRRYGFHEAADRISTKFLSMVARDFAQHGTIKEKYDVVTARSDLSASLQFGYGTNEIGFGWTNAAFLVLYDELSLSAREQFQSACPGS